MSQLREPSMIVNLNRVRVLSIVLLFRFVQVANIGVLNALIP